MSRFFNTITFGTVGARIALRRITSLALGLAMMPTLHAQTCSCEDGIAISVEGNIPGFTVEGAGESAAAEINPEMKPAVPYVFTLDSTSDDLANSCNSGVVHLECGVEYQLDSSTDSDEWTSAREIHVAVVSGELVPKTFRLRVSGNADTPSQNDETEDPDDDSGGSSDNTPEVPAMETNPRLDRDGDVTPAGVMISLPLKSIGSGTNHDQAPFRSAGRLISGGPVSPTMARPTNLAYYASEEVTGRPTASIWGPILPAVLTYSTPVGYSQEKHVSTPTRLFRVTGFATNPNTVANFSTALNTCVREYVRASSSESIATTLAKQPVSWWTVTAVTNGVKVTQSVMGIVKSRTFIAENANSLVVIREDYTTEVTLFPPGTTGDPYSVRIEKRITDDLVEKTEHSYEKVADTYQIVQDTIFPDPNGTGLVRKNAYYPSTAGTSAGKLWYTKEPTGAWIVYEYPGTGDIVEYTPFESEAIIDPTHDTVGELPLNPSGGLSDSTARIRRTINYLNGGSTQYVVSLEDAATSPSSGIPVRYQPAASDRSFNVANTSTDAIPDGILLAGNGGTITYSSQIPQASPNRWLAGLPVLVTGTEGRATYYQYQLSAGVFTITETTGFAISDSGSTATVGSYRFETVPNLSERTVTVRGPKELTSRETLYHTGSGFTRGRLEEFFYQNGRYHHTLVDGVETRRVEWPDSLTRIEKDAAGRLTTSKYSESGELLWQEIGAGGGVPAVRTSIERTDLITMTYVNGVMSESREVDGLGRTVSTQDQAGVVTNYTYPNNGLDTKATLPGGIEKIEEHYLDGSLKARSGSGWVASYHNIEFENGFSGYQKSSSVGSSTAHTARKKIEYYGTDGLLTRTVTPAPSGANRFIVDTYNYYWVGYYEGVLLSISSKEVERTLNSDYPEYVYYDENEIRLLPTKCNLAGYADLTDPVVVMGGRITQGLDLDGIEGLAFSSSATADRFTNRLTSYVLDGGVVYRKTTDYRYPDPTGANPIITQTFQSVSFNKVGTDSYNIISKSIEPSARSLTQTARVTPASATVVTTGDDSATTATADTITTEVNGYLQTEEKAGGGGNKVYRYDTFGRVNRYTDPRNALTISYYDNRFLLSSVTDQLNQTVSYEYYSDTEKNAGKLKTVTRPNGSTGTLTETTAYNDRGQPTLVNGTATYPQLYGYDQYGANVTLETYGTVTAVTRWGYQPATGMLESKRYDDAHKAANTYDFRYTYTADAKVATKTTGKGVVSTYLYDDTTRDLTNVNYTGDSDLTPDVALSNYDNLGRARAVTETLTGSPATTQSLTYDSNNGDMSIAYDANHRWLKNVRLLRSAPDQGRPTGFDVQVGTAHSNVSKQTYSYDAATSRLQGVSSLDLSSVLSLLPGAETINGTTVSLGGAVVHSRKLSVDLLGRTVGVENKAGTSLSTLASIATVGHQYDSAGRRKNSQREDGTWWDYSYNGHSEVTGATKKITVSSSEQTVPGLAFGYTYDDIGNRITSTSGTGSGVSPRTYGRNVLNRYTSITHDGKVNVLARADVSLTANTPTNATHNGIDTVGNFYGVRQTATSYSATGKLVTTSLKRSGTTGDITSQNTLTWVPPANFTPAYDADGNLTWDGRWTYVWDGENRLVSATNALVPASPTATDTIVKYAYDWAGRRLGRSVTVGTSTTYQSFVYDSWNPVAEWSLSALGTEPTAANLRRTNLWGPDISSMARASFGRPLDCQTAGGVAGLLASTYYNGSDKVHFIPSYDANGNVIAWSDGAGAPVQRMDYDPFGNAVLVENIASATTVAKLPAFGFSTKPLDPATGLYYYGYRHYDPVTGRWASRDPIQEKGGLNLYGFIDNNGVGSFDILGLMVSGGNMFGNYEISQDWTQPYQQAPATAQANLSDMLTPILKILPKYPVFSLKYGQSFPIGTIGVATITGSWDFTGKIVCCKKSDNLTGLMVDGSFSFGIGVGVGAAVVTRGELPKPPKWKPGAVATSDLPDCKDEWAKQEISLSVTAQGGIGWVGAKASYKIGKYTAEGGLQATLSDPPVVELVAATGASIEVSAKWKMTAIKKILPIPVAAAE